jgi:hypothetical protein
VGVSNIFDNFRTPSILRCIKHHSHPFLQNLPTVICRPTRSNIHKPLSFQWPDEHSLLRPFHTPPPTPPPLFTTVEDSLKPPLHLPLACACARTVDNHSPGGFISQKVLKGFWDHECLIISFASFYVSPIRRFDFERATVYRPRQPDQESEEISEANGERSLCYNYPRRIL